MRKVPWHCTKTSEQQLLWHQEDTQEYILWGQISQRKKKKINKKINENFYPECVLDTAKYNESTGTFGAPIVRHRKLISLKLTPLAFTV